jgi:hypothetical protein
MHNDIFMMLLEKSIAGILYWWITIQWRRVHNQVLINVSVFVSDLTTIFMGSCSMDRDVWTTLIKGNLEQDTTVFNSIFKVFNDKVDDLKQDNSPT